MPRQQKAAPASSYSLSMKGDEQFNSMMFSNGETQK